MTAYTERVKEVKHGTVDFLMKIIPTTMFDAFTKGDILQVLLFAILFGAGLVPPRRAGPRRSSTPSSGLHVLFKIIGFIVRLAPLGVLGAVAFTVGRYGIGSLKQLGFLVAAVLLRRRVLRGGRARPDHEAGRLQHLQAPAPTCARS